MKGYTTKSSAGPAPDLRVLGLETIRELETQKGILAFSRQEIYGCIFGRDSLITALQLLQAYKGSRNAYFFQLAKKILLNLVSFQGKEVNVQSGEEPGKCIHEFRKNNHDHLTKKPKKPWYAYPDGTLRNYDSLDSTPLFLMAVYKYWKITRDKKFLNAILPNIKFALDWILLYADNNKDGFLDYRLHPKRTFGGLAVQNWMDSDESLFHEDGRLINYPVAPVEVQAYAYASLKAWGNYFSPVLPGYGAKLIARANRLKRDFNNKFIYFKKGKFNLASGVDNRGNLITAERSSMGHCLWAELDKGDIILHEKYIPLLAKRVLEPDLFEPLAGIRTLSSMSVKFDPNSYHNGSIWPHDSGIILQGLRNFGFNAQAERVSRAIVSAINYFKTPLELFGFDGSYIEYKSLSGQAACRKQAWSAATLLIL